MKTCDKITLIQIMQHKEHFDQRLIEIAENVEAHDARLISENKKLENDCRELRQKNSNLDLKIKDLESQKYSISQKYLETTQKYLEARNKNDDFLEYLKKLEKEIEELKRENKENRNTIIQQEKNIRKHEKNIQKQESIIKKLKHMNSTNSNLPSSMDILSHTKPKPEAATEQTAAGKKRGGQEHHALHKSRPVQKADRIITKKVKKAPNGAMPVKSSDGEIRYYITQEVDLQLKSIITETRYYIDDEADELDSGTLSRYAVNPLVYSGNFKAAAVYLNQKGTVPLQRLSDMLDEISRGSIQLRPSTISRWCVECHKKSEEAKRGILKNILEEAVVHVDETGIKVNGKQYWIHTITNENGSIFSITKKRGDREHGPIKLLESYPNILVHDHFLPYQKLLCQHAECNAHIDRYLKKAVDFDKHEESGELLELMHEMLHRKKELTEEGRTSMPGEEIIDFDARYMEILKRGLKNYTDKNPSVKKKYEPEYVRTFSRMLIFKEDHLRFIKDFRVPYTNNNAERQCRAVKAKKNVSGQFVSELGGEAYVSILSLLQTAKLKNENALEALERLFQ